MGHIACTPKKPPDGERGFRALRCMRSPIILFLGKPRTGKATIMRALHVRYKLRHVDIVEIIKYHIIEGSATGHVLEDLILGEKKLIPRIVVLEMLKEYMCKYLYRSSGFVLDGWPRDLQQVKDFEEYIAPISYVMYVDLPHELALQRIAQTKLEEHGLQTKVNQTIAWRNAKFDTRTSLMLDYFEGSILTINGKKKTMIVYVEIMDAMDELFLELGIETPSRFV